MEKYVRCNWCGLVTEKWCWQQRQKDGSVIAKCQSCVDEGRIIPYTKEQLNGLSGSVQSSTGHNTHNSEQRNNTGVRGNDAVVFSGGNGSNNNP